MCVTNDYYTLPLWTVYLYPDADIDDLCVLSFDIEEKDIINHINESEFFTNNIIPPEKINIACFYNKRTKKKIPFFFLQRGKTEREGWDCEPIPVEIEVKEIPITELSFGTSQFFKKLSIKKLSITDEFFKHMTK